jgi:hypothetical protein
MEEEIHAYWANVEAAKRFDRLDGLRRQGIAIVSIG